LKTKVPFRQFHDQAGSMAGASFAFTGVSPFSYLFSMSNDAKISAECLTPILYVRDFAEAMNYYTEKLLFDKLWEWGNPPDFGAVRLGKVEIFFCRDGQGHPGTCSQFSWTMWMII